MIELKHEFESALTKHVLFKSKVRSFLYGSDISLEPILDPTKCQFGKWIMETGLVRFKNIPEMHELEKVHLDIHNHAIKLVQLKQNGKTEEALAGINQLNNIADEMVKLLNSIQQKAQKITPGQ